MNLHRRCGLDARFHGYISETAVEEHWHTFSQSRRTHRVVESNAVEKLAHATIDEVNATPSDPSAAVVSLDRDGFEHFFAHQVFTRDDEEIGIVRLNRHLLDLRHLFAEQQKLPTLANNFLHPWVANGGAECDDRNDIVEWNQRVVHLPTAHHLVEVIEADEEVWELCVFERESVRNHTLPVRKVELSEPLRLEVARKVHHGQICFRHRAFHACTPFKELDLGNDAHTINEYSI